MKIAFLGPGSMGSAMARNLILAGHGLAAYNPSRAKAEALLAEDDAVQEGGGLGRAGHRTRTAGRSGPRGLQHHHSKALARWLATEPAAHGQKYVSAPVFGRPAAAAAKKLLVVAAGEGETVQRCSPVDEVWALTAPSRLCAD